MLTTEEHVILVDEQDRVLGTEEKIKAHKLALLHRAFSVFVYRKTNNGTIEFLLQQRYQAKYHCGGLWSNTCCSHPRLGETIVVAGQRRLKEEMALQVSLECVGSFQYLAKFDNGLAEHELDHVLVGEYNGIDPIVLNEKEAQAFQWISVSALWQELSQRSEKYTPWFKKAFQLALEGLCLN